MKNNVILILIQLLLLVACVTTKSNNSSSWSIDSVSRINIGMHKNDLTKKFGRPYSVIKYGPTSNISVFKYENKNRMLAEFELRNDIVIYKNLEIYPNMPESDIRYIEKRLNLTFDKLKEPWCNPHSGPHREYFVNRRAGVKVVYNTHKKSITDISWLGKDDAKKYLTKKYLESCPSQSKTE